MDPRTADGVALQAATFVLWFAQAILHELNAIGLSEVASLATTFSGMAAGCYWIYSLIRKMKKGDRNNAETD